MKMPREDRQALAPRSVALSVAIAAIVIGTTLYFASNRQTPVVEAVPQVSEAPPPVVPPPPVPPSALPPVKFKNPFDRTEIFEFPAGTSEAAAREAVANLLMKRAQERLEQPDSVHAGSAVARR